MAHDESVLSELLAVVKAGDGTDLIRELAQWALQQLIDTEATGVIGAGRYERTDTRSNERTAPGRGWCQRLPATCRSGSPSCGRAPSSHRSSSPDGGSTRRCTR